MNEVQKDKVIENLTLNLPTLRTKANLTQAKLSEMIGISRQTLVAIETEKRKMSWNTFLSCLLVFQKIRKPINFLEFIALRRMN